MSIGGGGGVSIGSVEGVEGGEHRVWRGWSIGCEHSVSIGGGGWSIGCGGVCEHRGWRGGGCVRGVRVWRDV